MFRGRGHRPYRPPQLLTGRINDFPLVPETPVNIIPPPSRCDEHRDPESAAAEEPERRLPSASPVAPITTAVQPAAPEFAAANVGGPAPAQQVAAVEAKKAADHQLVDAAKSLKRTLEKLNSLDLDEPDAVVEISPEPPRAAKSASRTLRRVDRAANKNLSPRQRHSRLCSVCQHPDRDAIEEEFIHWHNPNDTRYDYQITSAALYRHAHAVGLFARRERNLRSALGNMIQRSMNITPTSDSILRAIRAYSCLNRDGKWTEPPAHVVVSSGSAIYSATRPLPPVLDVPPARRSLGVGGPAAPAAPARRAKNSRRSQRKSRRSTRNTLTNRKRRK
jgi:hypothetical protein